MQMTFSVGQSYFHAECHKQIEVHMPRVSFSAHADVYLDQQAMCEIIANDYKTWPQVVSSPPL
jgi:hypothetical protein